MTHVNLNVNVISSNVKAFQNANKDNLYYIKWVKLPFFSPVQDQKDRIYSTVRSKSTSATVNNLKPSTAYVFQIRAFTEAGYGTFGPRLEITTKEEATGRA